MLIEGNEEALGLVCTNNELEYSPDLQRLEQVDWYAYIIFYLKNLTRPSHLVSHKKIYLWLRASKYIIT